MSEPRSYRPRPFVLAVLDGWGLSGENPSNAIFVANTKNMDKLLKNYPSSILKASGSAVGLPEGQMGNSEVGHLNLGAGRVVYQEFTRINLAIRDGSFFSNRQILSAFNKAKKKKTAVHLMGLVSDGGVHSHINHLFALLDLAKKQDFSDVVIHCFLDGRDTAPKVADKYIKLLLEKINEVGIGEIGTVMGRYYAMDRDNRWDRTKLAYNALVYGEGDNARNALEAVRNAYSNDKTDEFVYPAIIGNKKINRVCSGDSVIFFNFRPDRARQLTQAFIKENFDKFNRGTDPPNVYFVTFTEYDKEFNVPVAYPPEQHKNILADVLADNKFKQLRIAETEKYAHVTFFFNGGEEPARPLEDRVLIPSPNVSTYDLKPEMSAYKVTDTLIENIKLKEYDFILVNYANTDMVGHTGDFEAAVKAVEAVDECVGLIVKEIMKLKGEIIITADHGNADCMFINNDNPHTAHTKSKVPFLFISQVRRPDLRKEGILADVSPTILHSIGIEKPVEMTGSSMVKKFYYQKNTSLKNVGF